MATQELSPWSRLRATASSVARKFWQDLVFPIVLSAFVIAVLTTIVLGLGLVQLQLRVHQAQIQDARFGTDVLETFADQIDSIRQAESQVTGDAVIVLTWLADSALFARDLLEQSSYVCRRLSITDKIDTNACQNAILDSMYFSADRIANAVQQPSQRQALHEEVLGIVMRALSIDPNASEFRNTLYPLTTYYVSFIESAQQKRTKIGTYGDYCRKLDAFLKTNSKLQNLTLVSAQAEKYYSLGCLQISSMASGTVLPFGRIQATTGAPPGQQQAPGPSAGRAMQANVPMVAQVPTAPSPPMSGGTEAMAQQSAMMVSELVFSYQFYKGLFGPRLNRIIIAPVDLTFMALVVLSSILGACLRFVFDEVRDPTPKDERASRGGASFFLKQSLVSVMVALLFYLLCRTSLLSLLDKSGSDGTFSLNPYLVSFIASVAGILSTETFQKIVNIGKGVIAPDEAPKT